MLTQSVRRGSCWSRPSAWNHPSINTAGTVYAVIISRNGHNEYLFTFRLVKLLLRTSFNALWCGAIDWLSRTHCG